jgi:hypothetical protein
VPQFVRFPSARNVPSSVSIASVRHTDCLTKISTCRGVCAIDGFSRFKGCMEILYIVKRHLLSQAECLGLQSGGYQTSE